MKYLLVLLLALFLSPATSFAQGDPQTCVGYPEPRRYLEAQGWWENADHPFPGSHIHLGTCFPIEQTISGVVHFDVVLKLHDMAGNGTIQRLVVGVRAPDQDNPQFDRVDTTVPVNFSCAVTDCELTVGMNVDTGRNSWDGIHEFHFKTLGVRTSEGSTFYTATYFNAYLDNGDPEYVLEFPQAVRSPGSTLWYKGVDYNRVVCGEDTEADLWQNPVSGIVTVDCFFEGNAGVFVSVDPSFHAVPPNLGTVLLDSLVNGDHAIQIDTTRFSNGEHKLFLRADVSGMDPLGFGSGILVMPFTVNN